MEENTIHPTAHIERNILIAATVVDTLTVLVLQLEGLTAEVHLPEAFAGAHEALVGVALEADGGTLCCRGRPLAYETKGQRVVAGRREVVVAECYGLVFIAVGEEGDEGCRLWVWQEVAPVVDDGIREVDGGKLLAVCRDDIAAYRTLRERTDGQRQALDFFCHHQHVVSLEHGVDGRTVDRRGHRGEDAEDVGLIGADDEVVALLSSLCVGRHVFLTQLFLIRNGDDDVTVFLLNMAWGVCLPKGFVLLQGRVKVHEVEEMIVCLFHCLNMRLGPGWLSPISSRRMRRRASADEPLP